MKNYADELLYEELSDSKKDTVGAAKRYEWTNRLWEKLCHAGDHRRAQRTAG